MSSLRFIGDLSLWQGLLLALLAGSVSWWLYWRESRVLNGAARWLLPSLRSGAIVLALLVLTAPVLHHRYREGQPGRLRFLVDSSRSMGIVDRHYDDATKMEIARSLGWSIPSSDSTTRDLLPTEVPDGDSTVQDSGQRETSASTSVPRDAEAVARFDDTPRYRRALDRLLDEDTGVLRKVRDEFEVTVQRFDRERTTLWESTLSQSTPLPADAQAWMLDQDQFGRSTELGSALSIGRSPTTINGPTMANDPTTINGGASTRSETDALANGSPANGSAANGSAAPQRMASEGDKPIITGDSFAAGEETLVLMSDGRNTAGPSPLAIADALATQRRPIFIVGYGGTQVPEDVGLVTIEHPERVFERDMLRGTLVVRDRMQPTAPLKAQIKLGSKVVWEETRTLSASDRGRIDFAFPVKALVETIQQSVARTTDLSSVPLHLEASIEPHSREADLSNNRREFHVSVVTKRSRLLLVDGRSRWETRYLHNMFDRDPAWQVDLVLPDSDQDPARPKVRQGTEANQWPSTKERLLEYDLVILGELPAGAIPPESIDWLKAFVQVSGGGLIVIDGARATLRDPAFAPLQAMLPIEWVEDKRVKSDPVHVTLSNAAKQLSAFQLTPLDPGKNEATWAELSPLHLTVSVKALPGSEVLATTKHDGTEMPLIVTRQFGAGRVLYCGTDETWRWRYKVADTYHQRFWNQIARWVMRLPMSVQGQFVSIDSGKLVYQAGETVVIRSRLRDAQGEPATGLTVEAVVTEVGGAAVTDQAGSVSRVVAVVPLAPDPAIAGVYYGQINAPAGGNYHVSIVAAGLPASALAVHSEFSVNEPDSGEMDQLNCDESLLKKLAEMTGGQYLPEQRGDELADLLRPLSRGKIVESDTLLWQSYWWFVPMVLLLSIEWWLRKRVGLI